MATQATDGGRRATYTYRTMRNIMNELGSVIHEEVTDDADDDTEGGNNS